MIAGLSAGVVASLMDLDVDVTGVEAAMNLDEAFCAILEPNAPRSEIEAVADDDAVDSGADQG